MGFQDYLTMLRINRAKELLRSTNLSISEVCYQVGYQDIRTFNRVFKRVAALRPGEFKKLYGIRLLFGEQYGITICSTPGLGTDVTVTLPAKHEGRA